jgi:hypothetical protein
MTNEEIGRAFVALKCWRWMPGMLAAGPVGPRGGRKRALVTGTLSNDDAPRVVDVQGRRVPAWYVTKCEPHEVAPDVTDPATIGCLVALMRGALDDDRTFVGRQGDDAWIVWLDGESIGEGRTEAAAILNAIQTREATAAPSASR